MTATCRFELRLKLSAARLRHEKAFRSADDAEWKWPPIASPVRLVPRNRDGRTSAASEPPTRLNVILGLAATLVAMLPLASGREKSPTFYRTWKDASLPSAGPPMRPSTALGPSMKCRSVHLPGAIIRAAAIRQLVLLISPTK